MHESNYLYMMTKEELIKIVDTAQEEKRALTDEEKKLLDQAIEERSEPKEEPQEEAQPNEEEEQPKEEPQEEEPKAEEDEEPAEEEPKEEERHDDNKVNINQKMEKRFIPFSIL